MTQSSEAKRKSPGDEGAGVLGKALGDNLAFFSWIFLVPGFWRIAKSPDEFTLKQETRFAVGRFIGLLGMALVSTVFLGRAVENPAPYIVEGGLAALTLVDLVGIGLAHLGLRKRT